MERRQKLLYAGGQVLTALWTAITFSLEVGGITSNINFRLLTFIGFFLFVIIVWANIVTLNNQLEDKKPKVDIYHNPPEDNPFINDVFMKHERGTDIHTPSGSYLRTGKTRMGHIRFSNNPKYPNEYNHALKVSAKLSFFDMDENLLITPFYGRWGDTDQPGGKTPSERVDLLSVDLLSNGIPKSVDLVMKYPDDKECFAYSNESYNYEDFRNPKFKIEKDKFLIKVELEGIRVSQTHWFTVHNKRDDIEITVGK